MRRSYTMLVTLLGLWLIHATAARGQLSNYYFAYTSGDPTDMSGSTVLYEASPGSTNDDGTFSIPIGFNFVFNGVTYNSIIVGANGNMYPGTTAPWSDWTNSFQSAPLYPFIAPFWFDMELSDGSGGCTSPKFHYITKGVAPNRVLTVEWRDNRITRYWYAGQNPATFQARLYEGSNKIEFWYGKMNPCDVCNITGLCSSSYASIGIAAASNQFISVSFPGGTPTENRVTPNNSVNVNATPIAPNTVVVFGECTTELNGRIGADNGGTATMSSGDTFFDGFITQVGQTSIYRPFDIRMASPVCTAPYTLTISGPAAADYYFGTPGTQTITRTLALGGQVDIPEISFHPTASGVRTATLTVTGLKLSRTFTLAAYAPYVNYIGNIPEGGTSGMVSGDVLLEGKRVDRHSSASFLPFTLQNVSNVALPVSYEITGGFGQYTITPGGMLSPGASVTPEITFNALGFGVVNAQLKVTTGPESRTFALAATSVAPGGEFRLGTTLLDTGSTLFTNTYVCIGSEVQALKVDMVNTGTGDFKINGAAFYEIDTAIRQGIPRYEFRRDSYGNLIPAYDYVVSLQPPTLPFKPEDIGNIFPITLAEGQSQTVYISFVGTANGKRYARGYIYTNSENTAGPDTLGVVHEGIVTFDVFGRGAGARLSGDMNGGLPKSVIFQGARLGTTSEQTLHLTNSGVCSLRISLPKLQVTAGDVDEFSIVGMPDGTIDPGTGDLVLPPGGGTDIVLGFTPLQVGSRRATLRLATNDSSIHVPGVGERGVYYVDLFGSAGAEVYMQGIEFGQALIGGEPGDHLRDVVRIVNTTHAAVTITSLEIEGTDMADFVKDQWPSTPLTLQPGDPLELKVIFAPQSGAPGERLAHVKLTTTVIPDGITAPLTGIAGTRAIEVDPPSLIFAAMTAGKFQRRMVRITNIGTMPVKIGEPRVTGPDAANFQLSNLERTEMPPQGFEFIEVTYAPTEANSFVASLVINGNASNAPATVALSGTAFMPERRDDDWNTPVTGVEEGTGRAGDLHVSGVEARTNAGVISLGGSVPNPARETVEFTYQLPVAAEIHLALYDATGRLVRVLEQGPHSAGSHTVRIDVRELPAGAYHYHLSTSGVKLTRTLQIVR